MKIWSKPNILYSTDVRDMMQHSCTGNTYLFKIQCKQGTLLGSVGDQISDSLYQCKFHQTADKWGCRSGTVKKQVPLTVTNGCVITTVYCTHSDLYAYLKVGREPVIKYQISILCIINVCKCVQLFMTGTDSNIMYIKPDQSQEGQPWQRKEGKPYPHCRASKAEIFSALVCIAGKKVRLTALIYTSLGSLPNNHTFPNQMTRETVLDLDGTDCAQACRTGLQSRG